MSKLNDFFTVEEVKEKKKILFFDLHNLAYRTIFICAPEYKSKKFEYMNGDGEKYTKADMYQNWKNMMLNNILFNIKDKKASKVVIALENRNNWRKEIYPEYKAQRKAVRDDAIVDFEEFFPILEEFIQTLKKLLTNVYFIRVDRCEGDDIIAVIAKKFGNSKDYDMELISMDKDFIQLQKFKNFSQFDPIKKEYIKSLNPQRALDIKILTGDKSDNIKGVKKRCGPKTAEKMLNEGLTELETDEDIKHNYIVNKKIIDFNQIPIVINDAVVKAYDDYEIIPLDGAYVWNWLEDNNFPKIHDDFQMFFNVLKDVM
jgi:5'-3' exonuclease